MGCLVVKALWTVAGVAVCTAFKSVVLAVTSYLHGEDAWLALWIGAAYIAACDEAGLCSKHKLGRRLAAGLSGARPRFIPLRDHLRGVTPLLLQAYTALTHRERRARPG